MSRRDRITWGSAYRNTGDRILQSMDSGRSSWTRWKLIFVDRSQVALLEIQLLYICTMGSIKLSILFLYLRLFGVSKRFRYALYGAVAIIVAWFGTCVTLAIMASWAVASNSLTPQDSAVASGVTSLVTDVLVLCFPLRMVWRLKTNRQTKVKLITLFLLGLL